MPTNSIKDAELKKFIDNETQTPSVRTFISGGLGLIAGTDYDTVTATYPTTSSELYTYTLSAVSVKTVTVTYTNSSKTILSSVVYA